MPGRCRRVASTRARRPIEAACRELREEVGTAKALLLRESAQMDRLRRAGRASPGPLEGQAGTARRRNGSRSPSPGPTPTSTSTAHDREFDAWQWVPARELPALIVPFKRPVYEAVLTEFADLVDAIHRAT